MSIQITVGSQVRMNDRSWICTAIDTRSGSCFARVDAVTLRAEKLAAQNTQHLDLRIDDFEAQDMVDWEQQVVELIDPGRDIFFIYVYDRWRKARKEQDAGTGEAADKAVEDHREGDVRPGGEGAAAVDTSGGAVDGSGRSGEEKRDSDPGLGEEGKHPAS